MSQSMMPVSDVRKALNELLSKLDRPVFVTQRGRVKAVLLDIEQYESLLDEMDDLRDACDPIVQRAFAEAEGWARNPSAAEARGDLTPLADVAEALGFTLEELEQPQDKAGDEPVQD